MLTNGRIIIFLYVDDIVILNPPVADAREEEASNLINGLQAATRSVMSETSNGSSTSVSPGSALAVYSLHKMHISTRL